MYVSSTPPVFRSSGKTVGAALRGRPSSATDLRNYEGRPRRAAPTIALKFLFALQMEHVDQPRLEVTPVAGAALLVDRVDLTDVVNRDHVSRDPVTRQTKPNKLLEVLNPCRTSNLVVMP